MDKDRKKELNDFYEKQKAQQRQVPTSVERVLQRDPRLKEPKFKDAYTRDPNLLFRSEDPTVRTFPPPMNNSHSGHTGAQPVKYSKIALVQKMGQFSPNTSFEAATVNFLTGQTKLCLSSGISLLLRPPGFFKLLPCVDRADWQVKLFLTENEFFQGIGVFDDIVRVKGPRNYNNQFYVHEILNFLERGHSLLDPACRCSHRFEDERAKELGISLPMMRKNSVDRLSIRDDKCELSRQRVPRSAQEIANEIAVGDLYAVEHLGVRLVDAMADNPKIAILPPEGKDHYRFAFRATFQAVSNKQELLLYVDSLKLCLREPSEKDTYNGVKQDVEALAEEGAIFCLYNAEVKANVIFPRRKRHELQVDDDIKELWRESKPPDSLAKHNKVVEETGRLLKAEGLTPTQQAARKEEAVKKEKRKRRRVSKKIKGANYTLSKN